MAKKRRFKGGNIPTSSMADIAFLLLIFFLVTTTIDMDKGLGMVLPAEGEEIEISKKNILNCLINSTGNVLLGGEGLEIRDLSKSIRQKLAENDKLIINDLETISEISQFIERGKSWKAEEGGHDDLVMGLVLFSWFSSQELFKELNNVDLRNKLYDTKMKKMEEDLTPFGFIEDGIDDTYTVEGGEVWQIYN